MFKRLKCTYVPKYVCVCACAGVRVRGVGVGVGVGGGALLVVIVYTSRPCTSTYTWRGGSL